MLIRKATREQIEQAIREVNTAHDTTLTAGRSAYGNTGIEPQGRGWRLTLKLNASTDPFHRHSQRDGGTGKRMNYVCWHGHREFMRALYRLAPDAVIRTGLAAYKGSQHFEETHEETAWGHNEQAGIGSIMFPCGYSDACDCDRGECPSRRPGRIARIVTHAPALDRRPEPANITTPEETMLDAGITGDQWADYNRKFNDLIYRGA